MDIERILSTLHYKVYYYTGRNEHWRNHQNFGLQYKWTESEQDNDKLKSLLGGGNPFFIGRYGTIELGCFLKGFRVYNRHDNKSLIKIIKSIIFSEPECWKLGSANKALQTNAGVFPLSEDTLKQFTEVYLDASKQLDLLASWQDNEKWLAEYGILNHPEKIDYNIIEFAFRLKDPWTEALEGKKVLVVSPFAQDIVRQYNSEHRDKLFTNKKFLPRFDLKSLTSVNSAGRGNNVGFKDWFQALEQMKSQISQVDFDIALLGCGAYAFPLGAYIKNIGKQAITVCGALQTYFGIYGNRTANLPERNKYWVRPNSNTRPKGYEKIEGSAYW
jgi:hypothetical protein